MWLICSRHSAGPPTSGARPHRSTDLTGSPLRRLPSFKPKRCLDRPARNTLSSGRTCRRLMLQPSHRRRRRLAPRKLPLVSPSQTAPLSHPSRTPFSHRCSLPFPTATNCHVQSTLMPRHHLPRACLRPPTLALALGCVVIARHLRTNRGLRARLIMPLIFSAARLLLFLP